MDELIAFDKSLLLQWNGSDSLFLDGFMWMYSTTWLWIPLALMLLVLIVRNNDARNSILIFILLALVIVVADRVSSGFCKPFFHRFRPTHDPEIGYMVDIVRNYRGGRYGFISSHAANSFALFTFTALLFKNYLYTFSMLLWALITCYSRIYLGVHYPGDILFGSLFGVIVGFAFYKLYLLLSKRLVFTAQRRGYGGNRESTRSGYSIKQINSFVSLFFLLNIVAMISGTIYMNL